MPFEDAASQAQQQQQQSSQPQSSAGPQKQRPAKYKYYHVVNPAEGDGPGAPSLPSQHQSSWPLSRSSNSWLPSHPVGPGQALHSTFASRMKLGVSSLMQPLPQQGDFSDPVYGRGGHSELAALPGSTRSGRMTKTTRYYEDESEIDDESDDGDDNNGHRTPLAGNASPRGRPRASLNLNHANALNGSRATPIGASDALPQPLEPPGYRLGKPPPGNRISVKRARRTPHVYFSDDDMARASDHREALIPIKIELELDSGHRIKDCFVWNINERLYTPDHFVRIFLQDLDVPYDTYGQQIEASIYQQIDEWTPLAEIDVSPAPGGIWACREPDATKGERRRVDISDVREKHKDARSWDWGIRQEFQRFHKAAKLATSAKPSNSVGEKGRRKRKAFELSTLEKVEGADGQWEDDLRVVVNYDVQILHHALRDRLEWDLSSSLTPEAFAAKTCRDLGLSGEALPIISAAVRENLLNHKRAVGELGLVGLGEMWGKAQADEEQARRELTQEYQAARRKRLLQSGNSLATPRDISQVSTPAPLVGEVNGLLNPATPDISGNQEPAATSGEAEAEADAAPLPPRVRLAHAQAVKQDLTNRGPRLLLGAWRDWFESKEFGPLLEFLPDVEVERREVEALRAMRRNRREMARSGEGGGGGAGGGGINIREARFRAR